MIGSDVWPEREPAQLEMSDSEGRSWWQRGKDWVNGDSPRQRWQQLVVAFVVYGVVALAAYWPILPGDSASNPTQLGGDSYLDMWYLKFTQWVTFHGRAMLSTQLLNAPYGVNTAQNTQMPLLGVVTSPLTALASPVASLNLLMWAAFPLSALAMAFVLKRWIHWFPAAFFGGLLYGFGPYIAGEASGHLNLSFVPLPPLIIMAAYELFVLDCRPVFWGSWLGALVVLQFYISTEIDTTCVLVTSISLIVLGCLRWRFVVARLRIAVRGLAVALVLTAACTGATTWFAVAGPAHFVGPAQGYDSVYHADLLGAVLPTPHEIFYPWGWNSAGARLVFGQWDENGSYLGPPLILLWLVLSWRARRRRWPLFAFVMVLITYLLSLGWVLTINGRSTSVLLPWDIVGHWPVLDNVLTSRISLYVMFTVAFAVAFGLSAWHEERVTRPRDGGNRRTGPLLLVAGVVATVVSLVPRWPYGAYPIVFPPSLANPMVADVIPAGALVLTYPIALPASDYAMLWQAQTNMRFELAGGYSLFVTSALDPSISPIAWQPYYVESALANASGSLPWGPLPVPPPTLSSLSPGAILLYLRTNGVGAVVLDRSAPSAATVGRLFSESLGRPRFEDGDVEIWVGRSTRGRVQW